MIQGEPLQHQGYTMRQTETQSQVQRGDTHIHAFYTPSYPPARLHALIVLRQPLAGRIREAISENMNRWRLRLCKGNRRFLSRVKASARGEAEPAIWTGGHSVSTCNFRPEWRRYSDLNIFSLDFILIFKKHTTVFGCCNPTVTNYFFFYITAVFSMLLYINLLKHLICIICHKEQFIYRI